MGWSFLGAQTDIHGLIKQHSSCWVETSNKIRWKFIPSVHLNSLKSRLKNVLGEGSWILIHFWLLSFRWKRVSILAWGHHFQKPWILLRCWQLAILKEVCHWQHCLKRVTLDIETVEVKANFKAWFIMTFGNVGLRSTQTYIKRIAYEKSHWLPVNDHWQSL